MTTFKKILNLSMTASLLAAFSACSQDAGSTVEPTKQSSINESSSGATLSSGSENNSATESLYNYEELKKARPITAFLGGWAAQTGMEALDLEFEGIKVSEVIDRIALQAWKFDREGTITSELTEEDAKEIVKKIRAKGIAPLLCIVNVESSEKSFDWTIVREALVEGKQEKIVKEILRLVDEMGFAGVDLNIEAGPDQGPYSNDDRDQFVAFVNEMADSLHARGLLLTVPTYQNSAGAPGLNWIEKLDKADNILPMALQSRYAGGPADFGYKKLGEMTAEQGVAKNKVQPILPMWMNAWEGSMVDQGVSAAKNIDYLSHCLEGGVGFYSLHHMINGNGDGPKWQDAAVWKSLKSIKDGKADGVGCDIDLGPKDIVDDMSKTGTNFRGGLWIADTDYWQRKNNKELYPDHQTTWDAATRIWNLDMDYDLALQMGQWADIGEGYTQLDDGSNILETKIEVTTPIDPNASEPSAQAGFIHEFEARDCEKAPSACWEVNKTGISRDLSGFDTISVGLKCTKEKQIFVSLYDLDGLTQPYGLKHDCNGSWEDVNVSLKAPEPIFGSPAGKYDASQAFRVMIGYLNDGQKDTVQISVAAITLDRSAIEYRKESLGLKD